VTGTKVTRGFGSNSPPKNPKEQLRVDQETEASSPDMEGPIALIAPELPEDTLLDVRKQVCLTQHFSRRRYNYMDASESGWCHPVLFVRYVAK